MNSNFQDTICMSCFIAPCCMISLVFGIEPFYLCNCKMDITILQNLQLKNAYTKCIRFILWVNSCLLLLHATPIASNYVICKGWFDDVSTENSILNAFFGLVFLAYSICLSFIRNNKLKVIETGLKNEYFRQTMINENNSTMRKLSLFVTLFAMTIVVGFQLATACIFYPSMEKRQYFEDAECISRYLSICCIQIKTERDAKDS
ncbi:uncharacterized protein LOC111622873 [Centruroides sculpturatus]|uniref:uncharacterized protein LOC111622873 n=1 Tax=Centruroides sculpturatus TaxID=218467 RepID=UPI000C6E41A0|nr:uncharacterized protein LOC111622873 [Centruroides sculpturatus]